MEVSNGCLKRKKIKEFQGIHDQRRFVLLKGNSGINHRYRAKVKEV